MVAIHGATCQGGAGRRSRGASPAMSAPARASGDASTRGCRSDVSRRPRRRRLHLVVATCTAPASRRGRGRGLLAGEQGGDCGELVGGGPPRQRDGHRLVRGAGAADRDVACGVSAPPVLVRLPSNAQLEPPAATITLGDPHLAGHVVRVEAVQVDRRPRVRVLARDTAVLVGVGGAGDGHALAAVRPSQRD